MCVVATKKFGGSNGVELNDEGVASASSRQFLYKKVWPLEGA